MPINVYLFEKFGKVFEEACGDAQLKKYPHSEGVLTGYLENEEMLGGVHDKFVLGRRGFWVPRDVGEDCKVKYVIGNPAPIPIVTIKKDSSPYFPYGLILASESMDELEETADIPIEILRGTDDENFIGRALKTFGKFMYPEFHNEKDGRLVVIYDANNSNPPASLGR